jgi:hypothetical protein
VIKNIVTTGDDGTEVTTGRSGYLPSPVVTSRDLSLPVVTCRYTALMFARTRRLPVIDHRASIRRRVIDAEIGERAASG